MLVKIQLQRKRPVTIVQFVIRFSELKVVCILIILWSIVKIRKYYVINVAIQQNVNLSFSVTLRLNMKVLHFSASFVIIDRTRMHFINTHVDVMERNCIYVISVITVIRLKPTLFNTKNQITELEKRLNVTNVIIKHLLNMVSRCIKMLYIKNQGYINVHTAIIKHTGVIVYINT